MTTPSRPGSFRFAAMVLTTLRHGPAVTGCAEPGPVELVETDQTSQLRRSGEPDLIRGAGGQERLEELSTAPTSTVVYRDDIRFERQAPPSGR